MADHPNVESNVELVRRCFDALARNDDETLLALHDENVSYYAFDAAGPPTECRSRAEFEEMLHVGRTLFKEHSTELLDTHPVGDELVVAEVRSHSTDAKTGVKADSDFVMVFRVRNGRIVSACDFIDSAATEFMESAWK